MEKERKIKVLSLIALIVAVLGLTVAFAIFSETLRINGTAGIEPGELGVHFEKIKNIGDCDNIGLAIPGLNLGSCDSSETFAYFAGGDAKINTFPTIGEDGLSFTGFDVTLTKPDEGAVIMIPVVNEGDIDAKLSDILMNDISLAEYQDNLTEEIAIQYLRSLYTEADWDGDGQTTDEERMTAYENILISVSIGLEASGDFLNSSALKIGDVLEAGQMEFAYIMILFSSNCETLPKGNVKLNADFKYVFSQA